MPRYFFHLHEHGNIIHEEVGVVRDDLAAAHLEALRAAREVMCSQVDEGQLWLNTCIEVRDENDAVALTLPFSDAIVVTTS